MTQKIQLKHPEGKKAVSMDKAKCEILKSIILAELEILKEATHTELNKAVEARIKKDKIAFDGSVAWHAEWVKLDMEAHNLIARVGVKPPLKYVLVNSRKK